ncbi:dna recombination rmuc [Lucifera butyrica]|uniref:Dna recombination rmuc n=1 Tax=Lucifera butyrica TaxID=1351585 RepID=A0A498RFV6_9FIRM|nr:DNA recombination protein RmuC [Lucifera butyrica]VBB09895.1 dna recombination rmuc [Lucifera butyrica]
MEYLLLLLLGFIIVITGILFVILRRCDVRREFGQLERNQERLERLLLEQNSLLRSEVQTTVKTLREEVHTTLNQMNEAVLRRLFENSSTQLKQLEAFAAQLQALTRLNEEKLEKMRESMGSQLKALQEDNGRKLEEMRATVDEKLHATLEKRLGESFKLVSDRLEQVHKGLGEMQTLASGVGDLKRVLTNVKVRGIWGEVHLKGLLEQILTPDQYAENITTKPGSNDRVEFAVKLPGRDQEGTCVWLPVDAKFPQEDYQRLLDAQEQANPVLAEEAARALETRIKQEARSIAEKYISPPATTEFGLLFLPIEGLYAEVLRRPGLYDTLLRDYKVVVSGPTTLAAFLSSLQMGFRTLAVEKRSSEVWTLLGAVKTEFGKFGTLLDQTHKKLQAASNSIDLAARKTRTIERRLRTVQELPAEDAGQLLADVVSMEQDEAETE